AEPAAHLAAGIANRKRVDIELLVELIHQLDTAVMVFPSVLHPRVRPEWRRAWQGKGHVLAQEVVRRRDALLDGAVLNDVGSGKRRRDLSRSEGLDLELIVGRFPDRLGKDLGGAMQRIERLGKAGREPPLQLRHRLSDGWRRDRGCGRTDAADAGRVQ